MTDITKQDIRLQFASSIEQIEDINESFSSGVMRICYTGVNRNNSAISRSTIERAKPTMFNCPVVCNYDVESNSIGGHDVELLHTDDGEMRIVNLTNAVGVVPSGAKTWWETVDDNGVSHDYFTTEVILWKRSPAYQKIAEGGVTSQSMEISVKNGQIKDGVFVIDDFTFTAFCLLGEDVEPCFESASLQMFDRSNAQQQFALLMQELKKTISLAQSPEGVSIFNHDPKGGEKVLEEKKALAVEYGFDVDKLEFSIEDFTLDELRAKFEEMKQAAPTEGDTPAAKTPEQFALEAQFREELMTALEAEKVETCFGEMSHYWFVDYNPEAMEVYCNDSTDWKLYGFSYSMNGDNVIIDFAGKKRMKFSIVPFDEGEQPNPMGSIFAMAAEKFAANDTQWAEKYQVASNTIASMEAELGALRQFKAEAETAVEAGKRDAVFAQFEDLAGVEAFEELRKNGAQYSIEDLEEKCYAIRGRNATVAKFSHDVPKMPKLAIEKTDTTPRPYNGVFDEYGISPIVKQN